MPTFPGEVAIAWILWHAPGDREQLDHRERAVCDLRELKTAVGATEAGFLAQ